MALVDLPFESGDQKASGIPPVALALKASNAVADSGKPRSFQV